MRDLAEYRCAEEYARARRALMRARDYRASARFYDRNRDMRWWQSARAEYTLLVIGALLDAAHARDRAREFRRVADGRAA